MDFLEVIEQARALLERKGRVAYRTLRLQFQLTEEQLEGLKDELIDAERVAADEDGKVLVWVGAGESPSPLTNGPSQAQPPSQAPSTYTPQHLAERIRAEQQAMESRGATDGERKTVTALCRPQRLDRAD